MPIDRVECKIADLEFRPVLFTRFSRSFSVEQAINTEIKCDQLCLLSPVNMSDRTVKAVCACGDNYELESDGKTCRQALCKHSKRIDFHHFSNLADSGKTYWSGP